MWFQYISSSGFLRPVYIFVTNVWVSQDKNCKPGNLQYISADRLCRELEPKYSIPIFQDITKKPWIFYETYLYRHIQHLKVKQSVLCMGIGQSWYVRELAVCSLHQLYNYTCESMFDENIFFINSYGFH